MGNREAFQDRSDIPNAIALGGALLLVAQLHAPPSNAPGDPYQDDIAGIPFADCVARCRCSLDPSHSQERHEAPSFPGFPKVYPAFYLGIVADDTNLTTRHINLW